MTTKELFNTKASILDRIDLPVLNKHNVKVLVKRDDLIDPEVSGNKWRKLKYNLLQMESLGKKGILTFGGAFSNHLLATASAANKAGVRSIGIVRGDELNPEINSTLRRCDELGMQLIFVSRSEYQNKNDLDYMAQLKSVYNDFYFVPEGGSNYYGMIGCQEIMKEVNEPFDAVFVAQGTTATSCGVLSSLNSEELFVVPVLKGFDGLKEMRNVFFKAGIESDYQTELFEKCTVLDEYHFGGYGKYNSDLIAFIQDIYKTSGLKLDPIYTGKAFYALIEEVKKGRFDGETVLFVHTGGLQGVKGVESRIGSTLFD